MRIVKFNKTLIFKIDIDKTWFILLLNNSVDSLIKQEAFTAPSCTTKHIIGLRVKVVIPSFYICLIYEIKKIQNILYARKKLSIYSALKL